MNYSNIGFSLARQFAVCAIILLASVTGFVVPSVSAAKAPVFTGLVKGVGAGGYDTVAYFTAGKPVKGSAKYTHRYKGATWRFSSQKNLDMFKAAPARYAPQFGGYCAYAVSNGYTAKGDPKAWTIASGKLYLNYNRSVRTTWAKDIPGNVKKGKANWPKVLSK